MLFLSIGVGLLWLVLRGQDFNKIIGEFRNANYFWIFLVLIAGFLSHLARSFRWNILISTMKYKAPPISLTLYSVLIGYFANYAVPRLGEVTRCGVLSKNSKIPMNSLLGTVVAERIFDFFCLCAIIIFIVILRFDILSQFIYTYVFHPIAVNFSHNITSFIVIIILLISAIILPVYLIRHFFYKIKKLSFYYKLLRLYAGFICGIKAIGNIKNKKAFFFHTMLIWTMYFLMTYLCFFAIKETSHLGVVAGLTILAIGSIGIVVPIPGGIGSYHYFVILALEKLYNFLPKPDELHNSAAVSYAFISHTSQTLLIIILGSLSLLILFLTNKKYRKDAKA